jgi:hypothetical protein
MPIISKKVSVSIIYLLMNSTCYSSPSNGINLSIVDSVSQIANSQVGSNIKSIKFYSGDALSDPIIELGTDETITLEFDDLSSNSSSYSYSIIYCNSDWSESSLLKPEYIDGFDTNPINDYQNSVATTVPYTHIKILIPNSDFKVKLSGNYIIKVFDRYNPELVVFEKRFMVVENLLDIKALVKQPIDQTIRYSSQQIELSIGTSKVNIADPNSELVPIIIQNNQSQNSINTIRPSFIRSNEIVYSSPDKLIFDGVNEYRSFDINSIRYISSGLESIEHMAGEFNVQLLPSQSNRKQKYTTLPDINGKYLVKLERSEQSDIEADYVWVYFTLPYYDQLSGKKVYVYGELTGWNLEEENLMNYNYQRQAYELRLQLKQGYYNYRYAVRDSKTGIVDFTFFEGNHFETENSYLILIYYKQIGLRYERLIGVKRVNSRSAN